jgi:hypothetical protein
LRTSQFLACLAFSTFRVLISRGVWPKGPTAVRERVKETTAEKKSLQVHACISWTKAILLIIFSIIN